MHVWRGAKGPGRVAHIFLSVAHNGADHRGSDPLATRITSKDRADPAKVGLYQLFKKPGFNAIRVKIGSFGR